MNFKQARNFFFRNKTIFLKKLPLVSMLIANSQPLPNILTKPPFINWIRFTFSEEFRSLPEDISPMWTLYGSKMRASGGRDSSEIHSQQTIHSLRTRQQVPAFSALLVRASSIQMNFMSEHQNTTHYSCQHPEILPNDERGRKEYHGAMLQL